MGERMLRGSRLGAVSYESDRNTELAPRQTREYLCAKGHQFEVPFAVEAIWLTLTEAATLSDIGETLLEHLGRPQPGFAGLEPQQQALVLRSPTWPRMSTRA